MLLILSHMVLNFHFFNWHVVLCALYYNASHHHFGKRPNIYYNKSFPGGSVVKNLPVNTGDIEIWVQFLGREDPLEEGVATHSNLLAWRIPSSPRGAWQAIVHGVAKSRTQLKQLSMHSDTIIN